LNCAVVIAQFISSGIVAGIQAAWSNYLVAMIISTVCSFIAAAVSIVLYFVKTKDDDALLINPEDNNN
ncbi:transporter major facilitator family protein, partial [Entamoeba invadens IP1]